VACILRFCVRASGLRDRVSVHALQRRSYRSVVLPRVTEGAGGVDRLLSLAHARGWWFWLRGWALGFAPVPLVGLRG
jgi:hypothetical protein